MILKLNYSLRRLKSENFITYCQNNINLTDIAHVYLHEF